MKGEPNTPDLLGYVLAYFASAAVFAGGVGLWLEDNLVDGAITAVGVAPVIAVLGLPLGAVLMPVVHLTCRRVRAQTVHVLVAGLVGVVGCAFFTRDSLALDKDTLLMLAGAAFSTAVGRAIVIPLVRARRRPGYLPLFERDRGLV
jgi:hypothetical protein